LHYVQSSEETGDHSTVWWELVRHESRHMHPLNLY